ncbi:MAG: hypothetical protein V4558_15905, partial [Gemmatimonadota bacterium]
MRSIGGAAHQLYRRQLEPPSGLHSCEEAAHGVRPGATEVRREQTPRESETGAARARHHRVSATPGDGGG